MLLFGIPENSAFKKKLKPGTSLLFSFLVLYCKYIGYCILKKYYFIATLENKQVFIMIVVVIC